MYEKEAKSVCWKNKVMVFERKVKKVNFNTPYRMSVPAVGRCELVLGEEMEEVKEFKYLGTVLCKHGENEGQRSERAVKGKCVTGSLIWVMRGRNTSMEVKRGLRNILLPTLMYGSETWTWNKPHQRRMCAVEMNYLKRA